MINTLQNFRVSEKSYLFKNETLSNLRYFLIVGFQKSFSFLLNKRKFETSQSEKMKTLRNVRKAISSSFRVEYCTSLSFRNKFSTRDFSLSSQKIKKY